MSKTNISIEFLTKLLGYGNKLLSVSKRYAIIHTLIEQGVNLKGMPAENYLVYSIISKKRANELIESLQNSVPQLELSTGSIGRGMYFYGEDYLESLMKELKTYSDDYCILVAELFYRSDILDVSDRSIIEKIIYHYNTYRRSPFTDHTDCAIAENFYSASTLNCGIVKGHVAIPICVNCMQYNTPLLSEKVSCYCIRNPKEFRDLYIYDENATQTTDLKPDPDTIVM